MCLPMWAHWRHLANTTEIVLPSAHPSPQSKRQIDRCSAVLAQLTAGSRYTYNGLFFLPNIAPSDGHHIWTPSYTWFPGPTQVFNPNGISIGSAVFAGLTSVTDRQTMVLSR